MLRQSLNFHGELLSSAVNPAIEKYKMKCGLSLAALFPIHSETAAPNDLVDVDWRIVREKQQQEKELQQQHYNKDVVEVEEEEENDDDSLCATAK
ncbi:Hypothetical predicted protein [Octopus vulgaris]|uniref:Uncharacterized protein n=1 Tax=Octopus vulgaris TaxID=6645 RepID=A0AA36AEW1_OCTVU|nr:Hypothetical predicted protein [Octopus vulgaris]